MKQMLHSNQSSRSLVWLSTLLFADVVDSMVIRSRSPRAAISVFFLNFFLNLLIISNFFGFAINSLGFKKNQKKPFKIASFFAYFLILIA